VLLLDLAKFDGYFTDLILIVLHSGGIIRRFEQGVLLNKSTGTIIQPIKKTFRNGLDTYLNFFAITERAVAPPTKLV